MSGSDWCLIMAALYLLAGIFFMLPYSMNSKLLMSLPRAKIPGIVLSSLAWIWTGYILITEPIDFLAVIQPFMYIIIFGCMVATWFALSNLLMCRAIAGFAMLMPMPLIIACRDYESAFRLIPISLSYIGLTLGMIIMFYPWVLRDWISRLAKSNAKMKTAGVICLVCCAALVVASFKLTDFFYSK